MNERDVRVLKIFISQSTIGPYNAGISSVFVRIIYYVLTGCFMTSTSYLNYKPITMYKWQHRYNRLDVNV